MNKNNHPLSEYKHFNVPITIISYFRNSNVKSTDNIRKGINLKPLLIVIGILFTLVGLAAVIMSIYLFILINKTATSTNTSKNKLHF